MIQCFSFGGCAGGAKNTTSDCYIRCLFEGLLGNETTGSAPLGGNLNATGQRLLSAFQNSFADESAGGCPELPANETVNQTADAWGESRAVAGIQQMKLCKYSDSRLLTIQIALSCTSLLAILGRCLGLLTIAWVLQKLDTLTHPNGSMTNGNSADAAGAAAFLLKTAAVERGLHVSETVTEVHAEINTLFGKDTRSQCHTYTKYMPN